MDCDHIGWKYWKLITWTISPTPSLFVAQRNMGKFVDDYKSYKEDPDELDSIVRLCEEMS